MEKEKRKILEKIACGTTRLNRLGNRKLIDELIEDGYLRIEPGKYDVVITNRGQLWTKGIDTKNRKGKIEIEGNLLDD